MICYVSNLSPKKETRGNAGEAIGEEKMTNHFPELIKDVNIYM